VGRAVARIHVAPARTEAVRLDCIGDFADVRRALRVVARRIGGWQGEAARTWNQ